MSKREFHPIERVLRYGVAGVLVSLAFSLGVIGFVHILPEIGPVGASVLAFCVVQPIGYVIHRTLTFPDTDLVATPISARVSRFVLTNLTSLAIATGGMALVTNVLRASYLWGIALNWVLIPGASFLLYRFWVFKDRSQRRDLCMTTTSSSPASPDTAGGSPERFGFSWDMYAELRPEHEEQFRKWTSPLTPDDWRGKTFLDAGCGMGRNSYWPLRYGAARGCAIDVDDRSLSRARQTLAGFGNIEVRKNSIYEIPERDAFNIVFSIGVVHHLERPDMAVAGLVAAAKPGGTVLVWLYGRENNGWIIWIFNPLRRLLFSRMPLSLVHKLSLPLTAMLWAILRCGISRSPYMRLLRGFAFRHLQAIVFDHMIPRIALYYDREGAIDLLRRAGLTDIQAEWTNKMSWTVIGRKPA